MIQFLKLTRMRVCGVEDGFRATSLIVSVYVEAPLSGTGGSIQTSNPR